jgi:Serine/threonine protein kinase
MRDLPELSDTQKIRVGDVVADRYEFVEKLGEGGMGAVFKAEDLLLMRTVAVKVMAVSGYGIGPDEIVRFQREAKSASNINHANVIKVLDFGVTDRGQPYMVMEYVPGVSLLDLIRKRGPQPIRHSLFLLEQICDGMSAVHKEGIVHRDLKSSNIVIIDQDGQSPQIKILDFGIAKSLSSRDESLTQTGQALGSPSYMSPEQARGDDVDARSDVYSLGCIAFELMSGRPQFIGDNAMEIITQHLKSVPPSLAECNSDITYPPIVEKLVAQAVAKDRDQRFSSMADMKAHINETAAQMAEVPNDAKEQSTNPQRKGRLAPMLIGTLTAILISLFGALYVVGANTNWLDGVMGTATAKIKIQKIKLASAAPFNSKPFWKPRTKPGEKNQISPRLEKALKASEPLNEIKNPNEANLGFELLNQTQQVGSDAGAVLCMNNKGLSLIDSYVKEKQSVYAIHLIKCTLTPELLKKIKTLKPDDLKIRDCDCSDADLKLISEIKSVKNLWLDGKSSFTTEGLKLLRKMPIDYLVIRTGTLGNEDAEVLAKHPTLRSLNLSNNTHITAKGLNYFLAVKRKLSLNIYGCACALVPSGKLEELGKKHDKLVEGTPPKESSDDVQSFCQGMGWEVPKEVF